MFNIIMIIIIIIMSESRSRGNSIISCDNAGTIMPESSGKVNSIINCGNAGPILKILSGVGMVVFVWEHIGRQYQTMLRPSVALEFVSTKSQELFRFLGTQWAKLSSYLTWINLEELQVTIKDLAKPTVELIGSPLQALKGYYEKAITYQYGPWQIYLGSFLLCGIFGYLMYNYGKKNEYIVRLLSKISGGDNK